MNIDVGPRYPMTESNVIRFPQPAEDGLSPGQRMAEVARLAEHVAAVMGGDDTKISIGELLDKIENASVGLSQIGTLTLLGSDRLEMEELCRNVQVMIGRIRSTLVRTGVEIANGEDDSKLST